MHDLCVVTACDLNELYFALTCDLLASIRASPQHARTPAFVINGGMHPEQQAVLTRGYAVAEIVDPSDMLATRGWAFDVGTRPYVGMIARAYIPVLFPGFRYYLYLDGDTWVHDEGVIERYVALSARQGVSAARVESECFREAEGCTRAVICDEMWDESAFRAQPYVCSGAFCVDADSDVFAQLQDAGERNRARGVRFFTEQSLFNVVYSARETLDFADNFLLSRRTPRLDAAGRLADPLTGRLIGLVHLSGSIKHALADADLPLRYRDWVGAK
jgi:hypothetical protein